MVIFKIRMCIISLSVFLCGYEKLDPNTISFTDLSHLGTCSQKLLLLTPHQTQTVPSSVCDGGS